MIYIYIAGAVVRWGEDFFIMGGRSGIGRFNKCWKFKPEKCEWSEIKKMKIGRYVFFFIFKTRWNNTRNILS